MHNKQFTPLQFAIRGLITVLHTFCISQSKLSIESVKTICSAPQTGDGDTLLHLVAQANMFNSVKMLVENHLCDPEKTNNYNQTSLHFLCKAVLYDVSKTSLFLYMHGCDVHKLDDYGYSPTSYALQSQEMIAKGYCSPTKYVQSLEEIKEYCHNYYGIT